MNARSKRREESPNCINQTKTMSKVLDVNELLELALECRLPDCEEHVNAMEAATTLLTGTGM